MPNTAGFGTMLQMGCKCWLTFAPAGLRALLGVQLQKSFNVDSRHG